MKKILVALGLLLLGTEAFAQDGAQHVTASQTIQSNGYSIQVGVPYLGQNINSIDRTINPVDVRFPWDILYLYNTFEEESFDVSKGYFGDKVLLIWSIRNNIDDITNIKIYRREFGTIDYDFISNVSPIATEYEDEYVEGGVLYEYKVEAEGVSDIEELYNTYITGIGYRSPTAVVTGNISYEGGNPVKDVIIKATPQGSNINTGSALVIPAAGQVEIEGIENPITSSTTLQAWIRPAQAYTNDSENPIRVFGLRSSNNPLSSENPLEIKAQVLIGSNIFKVTIAGSEYLLENYYPSGNLNARGDDELLPIANLNTDYVHLSVVLKDGSIPVVYINGREISQTYRDEVHNTLVDADASYVAPYFQVTVPTQTVSMKIDGNDTNWDDIYIGGDREALVDEIRIWKNVLDPEDIRTDFKRYISGNYANLIAYLTANEGIGEYAYDFSRNGFNYNKNHGKLYDAYTADSDKISWISGSGNIPTSDQLGILGVSDSNGNYEITSIPYSGSGESFTITPLYGQHQFEPNQQLVFLGQGAEVINKIDFTDTSSFIFKGKVLYDTQGVFPSFVEVNGGSFSGLTDGDEYVSGPGILDEGYNYYTKGTEKFYKGQYTYNDNGTPNDDTDDYLERYANIPSEEVQVFIDGEIVLDENNVPVTSDDEGNFEISVPIGNHYITVKKDGHEFVYSGRFPAETDEFYEFFEDAEESVIFVDTTRVTVVGRVVGGTVEAQKSIGFGANGTYTGSYTDDDSNIQEVEISSINNIGAANMSLGYTPSGGSVTEYTKFGFTTNSETGEYRVSVLPLNYEIDQITGLLIPNNNAINILSANESVNLSSVPTMETPVYEYPDGSFEEGDAYHFEKSFTYRTTPVLRVVKQTSDSEIEVNDEMISTDGFEYPVYTQFGTYEIELNSFERYINYDGAEEVEDLVAVTDGELNITNNLALAGSETITTDATDASIIKYSFKAGLPAISLPFTNTLNVQYRVGGVDYEAENYLNEGIILGGQSDGSQTFVTQAPDVPDIILRDPPGSNSFASIEAGQSITLTSEREYEKTIGVDNDTKIMLGVTFGAGGGLAGPVITSETTNNIQTGITVSNESEYGYDLSKTYTFTQTISTSDDPEFVGAEADLYIGQSKNYFYGVYDDIQVSEEIIGDSDSYQLTNTEGLGIYVSKQKAMYFVEEPSETFFVYSQKYILNDLIPSIELIISNIDNGIISETDPGVLTKAEYEQQINLWRKTILDNERTKYRALNDRAAIKTEVDNEMDDLIQELQDELSSGTSVGPIEAATLEAQIDEANEIKSLVSENFEDNVSFDAGVGEISKSVETVTVETNTLEMQLVIEAYVALELGFEVNDFGVINTTTFGVRKEIENNFTEEKEYNSIISYTLADDDPANLLSVDVVNAFDGNGPVFSTIGGATSCPYEGAEESYFYNDGSYDPDAIEISELAEEDREQLSYATQKTEDPIISVEVASVTNIPEDNKAEFVLKLENRADFTSDAASFNYFELLVDNTTNPNNAIVNLFDNGTVVYVPYGQEIYYTLTLEKSVSDIYEYNDIRVILQSRCDPVNVFSDVYISAEFVPSCSEVEVTSPLENWVYNRDTAYNNDGSTNPMAISLSGFSTTFNSFQKIDLEYRLASSPTWSRLHTYYTTQEFYDDASNEGQTDISLITESTLSHAFDIEGLALADGNYELRARTTCTNDTEYISEVIAGTVDLNAPERFGTPTPTDGILSAGEDIQVNFNEDIFFNSALSNIEIKGATNQLPIDNNVSLYFEGTNNTAVISNPSIATGDFTIEFWMNNGTTSSNATIFSQEGGTLEIGIANGELYFTLADLSARGVISNDGLFHHYTFTHHNSTGEISIYEDDRQIAGDTGSANIQFTNSNDLIIGGNTFIGNIHALRFWNKSISLEEAYANRYTQLVGNESNLIGYWPMNEGRDALANDIARFKHAQLNSVSWDIKPKGNSYEFANGQYLELDNVSFVQLTNEMDATLSFWVKTESTDEATLFSNGRGDGTDIVQSNGYANKWSIDMSGTGMLSLESEGNSYLLTDTSIADNGWHHIAILFNRIGSLQTYVDGDLVSSNPMTNIGGFSGSKIWMGARGNIDLSGITTVDRTFTGKLDEIRLWNTVRNEEQIIRDQYNEIDTESIGLMLYARMNDPENGTNDGPRYYHQDANETINLTNSILSGGTVNYTDDTPAIQPERTTVKFDVNHVINEDEMILEPSITDWASLEGQIVDITVHRMFDAANNMQLSPITWTAYINRNEVSWYAEGFNEVVEMIQDNGTSSTFEITVLNKGGNEQSYAITNIPNWMTLSSSSGTIAPDSKEIITVTIDGELAPGDYLEDLYLETDFGFDQKLQVAVKVLSEEPDWTIDPSSFDYSMNLVGRLKIDGVFSDDMYDKIAAFHDGNVRGVVDLEYNDAYNEYFAFITIYSNIIQGEEITFSIWDASQGKILQASVDGLETITFVENEVMGTLSSPIIFENTDEEIQQINLNQGWTWISLHIEDENLTDLNVLTEGMNLETSDRILSHAPSLLETFYEDTSGGNWSGTIGANGGLSTTKMYKMYLANSETLSITGSPVDANTWEFEIKENWNWLPFIIGSSQSINEAMAYFEAADGDIIKSQNLFAVYDPINGWVGTLTYLEPGQGYMISSSIDQNFRYPTYLDRSINKIAVQKAKNQPKITAEFTKYAQNMNAIVQLPEGYHSLYAYDEKGTLKATSKVQNIAGVDLVFSTIYGDTDEKLTFYVGNDKEQKETSYSFDFRGNSMLGTLHDPIVLENVDMSINVFPNPFAQDVTIEINALKSQTVTVRLYNLTNQLVVSTMKQVVPGKNTLKMNSNLSQGTYFLQIETGDAVITKKLIKK
ncbi:LamG-like jellyroll fold domain-containing protein [Aquimarina litoralis]|uniref:LamG-like jellyroll fold domain-containing protein n=1 Tax=Aquimarina litoralis TaxID=584605 RepID=UPI001C568C8B|nr:LamG-like jellyroll fold domain-containing protein [Aquimarina litoralis]MBW1298595.1 T9SS type A sorting domain-containing protein [Aquimarina litoralis]